MIFSENSFVKKVRQNLKGGDGDVEIIEYLDKDLIKNCRLFCDQIIPVAGSIGEHTHLNESEIYVVKSGIGIVKEKNGEFAVTEGNIVVTKSGETHSIKNTGNVPLIVTAIIVTH